MLAGPADSRWFDKSFSLIVNRSGTAAVNFEHSWADGLTVVRYCNEIYKDSETRPSVDPDMLSYGYAGTGAALFIQVLTITNQQKKCRPSAISGIVLHGMPTV